MASGNVEQDPTMEEILQSIKRIIAEDGDESAPEASPAPEEKKAPPKEEKSKMETASAPPAPQKETKEKAAKKTRESSIDEVLELTDMVRDDGTVVNLLEGDEKDVLQDIDAMVAGPAPKAVPEPQKPVEDAIALEVTDELAAEESVLEEVSLPDVEEPVMMPESSILADIPDDDEEPLDDDFEPEEKLILPADEPQSLVSSQAASATSAAFQQLMDAALEGERGFAPVNSGLVTRQGTTVEELLVEAMKPMLRQWLDENLPSTVERIVKEEIRKLVPR